MSRNRLLRQGGRKYKSFHKFVMAPEAMETFLHNPDLMNHDFMKQIPRHELLEMTNGFRFHNEPRYHQLVCFILGIDYPGFCFFVDMGGGKTKLTLDIIRYRQLHNRIGRSLIVVPYPTNTVVWHDEAKKHAPYLKLVNLTGTKEERDAALSKQGDVFVINYAGLFVMMCDLIYELTDKEKEENKARDKRGTLKKYRHRTGRRMNEAKATAFARLWDLVVFDESQFIGGHDTTQFDLCAMLALKASYSYVLTGTPIGRDPAMMWSQFFCADMGLTFGQKFTQFRSVFYDTVTNNFGTQYKFNKTHEKDLNRMIKNRSIRFEDTEFADLPPVTRQIIRVEITPQMKPYYEQRRLEMTDLQKKRQIQLIENKYHQLRAITSGYVIGDVQLEEDGVEYKMRVRSDFEDNPKLDAVKTLMSSLPDNRKITFYHEYVYSGDLIETLSKKMKMNPARLGGGRDGAKELRKFLDDKTCRVLVSQSKAGGVGTNLQYVCNYCCYFESPSSPITRKQSEKRFPREGQDKRVFIYDIVMDDTVDMGIQDDLRSGIDFLQRLLKSSKP